MRDTVVEAERLTRMLVLKAEEKETVIHGMIEKLSQRDSAIESIESRSRDTIAEFDSRERKSCMKTLAEAISRPPTCQ